MARPVPEPPQLLQRLIPVRSHVAQPWSPSDQRLQIQGTLLEPLQLGHLGITPSMALCSSASIRDLNIHAPAIMPIPDATWDAMIAGVIFLPLLYNTSLGVVLYI
eukprot:Gb_17801 [translate_table: standard]